jgi:hypothetical protein
MNIILKRQGYMVASEPTREMPLSFITLHKPGGKSRQIIQLDKEDVIAVFHIRQVDANILSPASTN